MLVVFISSGYILMGDKSYTPFELCGLTFAVIGSAILLTGRDDGIQDGQRADKS